MTAHYVARAHHWGRIVEEIDHGEDFASALKTGLRLEMAHPELAVDVMNLDGIDMGCADGLSEDERDAWWEVRS